LKFFIDNRADLVLMETYLLDTAHRVKRVVTKKGLEVFFGDIWDRIQEAELPSDDEKDEGDLAKEPGVSRIVHWLSGGLSKLVEAPKTSMDLYKDLESAMIAVQTSPLDEAALRKAKGGFLLLRTAWDWKSIDSKNRAKLFPTIAKVTLQEYVAAQGKRRQLLSESPSAIRIRQTLQSMFQEAMAMRATINPITTQTLEAPITWTWADELECNANVGEQLRGTLVDLLGQMDFASILNRDQDKIGRLIQSIERHPLARLKRKAKGDKDDTPVIALEVRHAVDHLLLVSSTI
jgi:hypothetical protein